MMMNCLLLSAIFLAVSGLEMEISKGQQECFFQAVEDGETITVEYMVTSSTGEFSRFDIDFKMTQPGGAPVVMEYRKEEGHHRYAGGKLPHGTGDYKICFDNSFSFVSSKTVHFTVEIEDDTNVAAMKNLENLDQIQDSDEFQFQLKAFDVEHLLYVIKQKILKASNLQSHMLISHGKDINLADRNIRRIDSTSLIMVLLAILSFFLQAYLIKEMFTLKM